MRDVDDREKTEEPKSGTSTRKMYRPTTQNQEKEVGRSTVQTATTTKLYEQQRQKHEQQQYEGTAAATIWATTAT
jgi:hypothetical protein